MKDRMQERLDPIGSSPRRLSSENSDSDLRFLRRENRPNYRDGDETVTIVDLFSGCGGMTLGLAYAAHRLGFSVNVPLAMDLDPNATVVFRSNFPDARCETGDVC